MNYPYELFLATLTIAQIHFLKNPKYIFPIKSQTPNYRSSSPVFLTIKCPWVVDELKGNYATYLLYGITCMASRCHNN